MLACSFEATKEQSLVLSVGQQIKTYSSISRNLIDTSGAPGEVRK
jgi:hypothetical protein